jgi:metal-sulfur cluster biosynthetic enzyme
MAALDTVMDPELDESLVELGFVSAEVLEGGRVRVELRLPTFWCAPNFAYLMAGDAREAVAAVPGVREVELRLRDHFAEGEVTAGVREGRTFDEAFAELADGGGLDDLRRLFWAKSFTMRQERLLRALLALGASEADLAEMSLGQVADSEELRLYLERRRRLGLPTDAGAPLAVMPGGRAIPPDELVAYLRRARSTRVGMEFNSSLCRGLLETRYPDGPHPALPREGGGSYGG